MGDFAHETKLCDKQFLPHTETRVALTADGLKFLAMHPLEMIPSLPALSDINDKRKANNFAKAFACMQALWFRLPCIERYHQELPVGLFEITTIAHCVYALSMLRSVVEETIQRRRAHDHGDY